MKSSELARKFEQAGWILIRQSGSHKIFKDPQTGETAQKINGMKCKSRERKQLQIIIEWNDGILWGRVENAGNFFPTPYGKNTAEVINNLKELVRDYVANEGKSDKFWNRLDLESINYKFTYDLQAYFHEHDYLKISSVAKHAGLNPGLVRQYASGVKYPSEDQTEKLKIAINRIAKDLLKHTIYTA